VIGSPVAPAGDSPVLQSGRPGATIDLDVKDVDIANVCRLLADVGHVSIVLADDVHGTVTVRLQRVRWARALDVILLTKGLRAEREGDVIVVYAK
jgi:type IV pilus assembly protein PilQ